TVLKNFAYTDGSQPATSVTLSGNVLYGTTASGGNRGAGVIFRLNTDGTAYAVIKNFTGGTNDGFDPTTRLIVSGSVLYGTAGVNWGYGMVFRINTDGTGFSVLKQFNLYDGASPRTLTLSGGIFYGTTDYGGAFDRGTAFKMDTNGNGFTVLKNFN